MKLDSHRGKDFVESENDERSSQTAVVREDIIPEFKRLQIWEVNFSQIKFRSVSGVFIHVESQMCELDSHWFKPQKWQVNHELMDILLVSPIFWSCLISLSQ